MTLGDVRTNFQFILNRTDCTDDQATALIVRDIQRIQRELRLPCMERLTFYSSDTGAMNSLPIPADLIEPIDLFVPAPITSSGGVFGQPYGEVAGDGELALRRMSYRQLQAIPASYPPTAYARMQSEFFIRGAVPFGAYVKLFYYGEFGSFASDADTNEITAANPDLVIYAALSYAADAFDHPKGVDWEGRYGQLAQDAMDQAASLDNNGGPGVVAPMHEC